MQNASLLLRLISSQTLEHFNGCSARGKFVFIINIIFNNNNNIL
jgi:hypothetical protein